MAFWEYYEPSQPRKVKGGIKAQSKRGAFGTSWWARRWIEALEDLDIGARLGRGRSYARQGQVLSVDIEKGKAAASVQGSRPKPYQVDINVKTLTQAEWKKLAEALSGRPIFVAKLLAGEMPQDIEDSFGDAELSLFPSRGNDLETECSCPDWSNPCKHIAAVYYLLGEEFDRDPFLIFKLRGIEREELIGLLGSQATPYLDEQEPPPPPEPLPQEPEAFWGQAGMNYNPADEVYIPSISAALPRRLGNFPFWRGAESLATTLEEAYRNASPLGLNVFLGEFRAPKNR